MRTYFDAAPISPNKCTPPLWRSSDNLPYGVKGFTQVTFIKK